MRVAIAGFGFRGKEWLDACRRGRVEVVGAADPSAEARAAAAQRGLRTWESLEDALADPWDAVILASPEHLHTEDIRRCLRAGRPSLVEKPMTRSWGDAVDVAREADERGVPVLVGQQMRYIRREVVLRRLLAAGVVGRPVRVTVASTNTRRDFRREVRDGIWHFTVHYWDAFRTRFGRPPDSIHARDLPEISSGSAFAASLVWEGGPEISYVHHDGTDPIGYHEWIGCETGSLVVLRERVYVDRRGRRPRRIWWPRTVDPEAPLLRGLEAAVAGRPPADLGSLDNLQTIAMVEATVRSMDSGRPVRVPDLLGEASEGPRAEHHPGA